MDNVSEALRDSCNVFFYTTGFRLASKDTGSYDDENGMKYIQKYASIYGLDQKSGVEIVEKTPSIATQYPVMAAIGQSNNNFTTISLSRYVTAVASGKLYDYKLMNKIVDADGKTVKQYDSNQPIYQAHSLKASGMPSIRECVWWSKTCTMYLAALQALRCPVRQEQHSRLRQDQTMHCL